MYLFLPFLFAWVKRKRVFWPLLILWTVSLFTAWAQPHVSFLNRASLLRYVPCFLPGIIAFALGRRPRLGSFLWPVFVFGLIAIYTLKPGIELGWFLCLLLGIGIPFFHEIHAEPIRRISNRIATYSYGIYISHQFCIWFALEAMAGGPLWLRIAVLISSLILVPILLYHLIEKPMIQAGASLAACFGKNAEASLVQPIPKTVT
jgi:peptidoglycan/LPS O-acetylase OafA/YrhL